LSGRLDVTRIVGLGTGRPRRTIRSTTMAIRHCQPYLASSAASTAARVGSSRRTTATASTTGAPGFA
jgi:hypothetical protein